MARSLPGAAVTLGKAEELLESIQRNLKQA